MTVLHQSAVSLAAAIRAREISATELVQESIARRERLDPQLNAIVWHDDDAPREHNDVVVDLLLDAGFVLNGRSNSPEAGPMSVTENQRFGVTRNPWSTEHSPAGSSGGAAVAVAAGYAPVAHAGDGGGSIRMPSSATGLVGLKPSRGRIPTALPGWEHSITEGVITRHVIDAAAVLDELSAPHPRSVYAPPARPRPFAEEVGVPVGPLRVGLLVDAPSGVPTHPEARAAAEALGAALERLGCVVEPVSPFLYSPEAVMGFLDVVVNSWLWGTPYDHPELAEPYIRARRERALQVTGADYAKAATRLYVETAQVTAQWGRDFDVLLTPTMATTPPLAGTVLAEANEDFAGARVTENQMVAYTAFCNIAGLPAISLPVHRARRHRGCAPPRHGEAHVALHDAHHLDRAEPLRSGAVGRARGRGALPVAAVRAQGLRDERHHRVGARAAAAAGAHPRRARRPAPGAGADQDHRAALGDGRRLGVQPGVRAAVRGVAAALPGAPPAAGPARAERLGGARRSGGDGAGGGDGGIVNPELTTRLLARVRVRVGEFITALRIEAPRESPYADLNDAVIVGSLGVEEDAEGLLILLEYWQAVLAGDEA